MACQKTWPCDAELLAELVMAALRSRLPASSEGLDVNMLARAIEVGCRGGYIPELPLLIVAERVAAEYARLATTDTEVPR